MYGQHELSTLLHDPAVTDLLDSSDYIWFSMVQPNKGPNVSGINYYRSAPVGPLDYLEAPYSVNCRAATQAKAEAIARSVRDVVNRHSSDSVFFTCSVLAPIPPSDQAGDNFNVPVEILAKGRNV